jgi:crotonobetainyl-CoA:carnitine CoA-transferase CaiB-like acyl-CoA transferase
MKHLRLFSASAPLAVLVLAAGCATPRPVLDLAGQGAATVGLAQVALRDYLQLANAQAAARMNLVRYEAAQDAQLRNRQAFESFLAEEAGEAAEEDTIRFIKRISLERRQVREAGEAELAEIDRKYSADVLERAQVPAEKLTTAKSAFAVLSQELTAKEWIALASGYAKEIQGNVKALRSSLEAKNPGTD